MTFIVHRMTLVISLWVFGRVSPLCQTRVLSLYVSTDVNAKVPIIRDLETIDRESWRLLTQKVM